MRDISKRVMRLGALLALLTVLSGQAAYAAPRGDDGSWRGDGGWRGTFVRVVQRVVKALEDCRLGFPPG
jgi:hypothetical protein